MKSIDYKINAFSSCEASLKATGNPATVIISERDLPHEYMAKTAVECGSPITTFIFRITLKKFKIQFYAPNGNRESLCGHGIIAANIALFNQYGLEGDFSYITDTDEEIGASTDPILRRTLIKFSISEIVPIDDKDSAIFYDNDIFKKICDYINPNNIQIYKNNDLKDYIVHINAPFDLSSLKIDSLNQIKELMISTEARTICITSRPKCQNNVDYEARLFYKNLTNYEDIACGSINKSIAKLWSDTLNKKNLKCLFPYQYLITGIYGGVQYIQVSDIINLASSF